MHGQQNILKNEYRKIQATCDIRPCRLVKSYQIY